jgi:hypothetical protein
MSARTLAAFSTIRTEGAMLPSDILVRVASGDKSLGGLEESSYHLVPGEKIGEATNQAWNRLQAAWANFQSAREKLAGTDTGTSLTRERWLLPLFQLLDYGRLQAAKAEDVGGKSYAISHAWQQTPIHLVGCNVDLDRRIQTAAGGMRSSPHSLLQELLNRSDQHLWGIVSNGLRLRLLRDNISLTRQAYVEFDLEAMMAGEAYPDFVLLWLLLHQSRFEAERPDQCQLENWSQAARTEGVRLLDGLRDGVQRSIEHLGQGFLAHPANTSLRENLRSGALDKQDYYRQILRLVYRLLFLFVAEDRDLLLAPTADPAAQRRYRDFYATTRLRRLASTRAGSRHHDLYCGLKLVMEKLSGDGCAELALPALGSFLFSPGTLPAINDCEIANLNLLAAVRSLAVTQTGQSRRVVDYKNLGAEELGSVYESLLELHPEVNTEAATFELKMAAGSERKTTGSYYTPTTLIDCLLNSALDPVVDQAGGNSEPEKAILALKVVDPACGSGHFLIAAAHRIAKRLASVRTGEEEPPPEHRRKALRDVIGHCLYGVDLNPMAVELCKVNLWMEALEPGKPLSFLEHRILPGNALLGTMPALMEQGIPDAAFSPLEGDNREACTKWRKVNKAERAAWEKKQQWLGFDEPWMKLGNLAQGLAALDNLGDGSITAIREKERLYAQTVKSSDYLDGQLLADAWCAAFVWKKNSTTDFPITEEIYRQIERNPSAFQNDKKSMMAEIRRIGGQYHFFHWHLAFPDVFRPPQKAADAENPLTGWNGGFDAVLGNPPWERIKLQEREWFASRRPDIAAAPNAAARRRMIAALETEDPVLFAAFRDDLRATDGEGHLLRNSGRFPLCGKGDINTYAVFAETNRALLSRAGRLGCIVPSGIATDNTTKEFFASISKSNTLVSLYDFENAVGLFEGVGHGRFKFCLLTIAGSSQPTTSTPDFFFFAHHTTDLEDQDRHFTLTAEDIALINPNTQTCPIFRSKRDAEITKAIYRRVPVLIREGPPEENPWGIKFSTMFHMSNDSHLFRTQDQLEAQGFELHGNVFEHRGAKYLPLYEAKMMYYFTHRYGDYAMRPEGSLDTELPRIPAAKLQDPDYSVMPRYWVEEWEVIKATSNVPRLVIQAVEAKSEDLARQILSAWFAGYALAEGREHGGNTILIRNVLSVWGSMESALQTRFAAMALNDECPIDETDFFWDTPGMTYLEAAERLIRKRTPKWIIGFRDVTNATNERTSVFTVLPPVAVNHKAPIVYVRNSKHAFFLGATTSIVFDYVTRQNIGGTSLGYFLLKQLPVTRPQQVEDRHHSFVESRVLELVYTASDVKGYADTLEYNGRPFRWDDDRRFLLRCELDALYFHLYGIVRHDVDYIMGTFPITRRKEEQQFGEYRTKRVILEIYDAMAEATRSGLMYKTRLSPPPASVRLSHEVIAQPTLAAQLLEPATPDLALLPNDAWATPLGVAPENVALFALIDVLRLIDGEIDPQKVRIAAILVRKPALAAAFMDDAQANEWFRLVGREARPLKGNVIQISQFQHGAADHPWADAISQLKGSGGLVAASGKWSAGDRLPLSSGQDWISGRASVAVQLLGAITPADAEQGVIAFIRSVEDGTARRAIS